MRRYLALVITAAACGGTTPRATEPAAAPTATPPPTTDLAHARPAMYGVPVGWTDLLHADRDAVERVQPGLYDHAQELAARDGYDVLAMPLDPASPDRGSQMTELPAGLSGPVDQRLLDAFVADNNLGLTPDVIVEKKLLDVGGRPIAKVRAEYQGAQIEVDTLTYLYPVDSGVVRQLVFTVRADRYLALRPQLEAIEGSDPKIRAVQDMILRQRDQQLAQPPK